MFETATGGRNGDSLTGLAATSSVVIALGERCYSQDHAYRAGDARLIGFDARSGTVRWSLDDRFLATRGEAHLVGDGPIPVGTVRATGHAGARVPELDGIDPATGRTQWRTGISYGRVTAMTEDVIVVQDPGPAQLPPANPRPTVITGLSRATGETLWVRELDADTRVDAVAADLDRVAVAHANRPVFGGGAPQFTVETLAASSGEPLSTVSFTSSGVLGQVLDVELLGSNLVVLDDAFLLRSFDADTGEPKWSRQLEPGPLTRLLVPAQRDVLTYTSGTQVSGPRADVSLTSVRADSGEALWTRRLPTHTGGLASDPSTVALYDGTKLVGLDLLSGARLWTAHLPEHGYLLTSGRGQYVVTGGCETASD